MNIIYCHEDGHNIITRTAVMIVVMVIIVHGVYVVVRCQEPWTICHFLFVGSGNRAYGGSECFRCINQREVRIIATTMVINRASCHDDCRRGYVRHDECH